VPTFPARKGKLDNQKSRGRKGTGHRGEGEFSINMWGPPPLFPNGQPFLKKSRGGVVFGQSPLKFSGEMLAKASLGRRKKKGSF